jgi:predicted MPP superfamily phosphohydrolase
MALTPLFVFSLLVHALVAWRLLPDLAQGAPLFAWLFSVWLAISTILMPMGMVAQRFARAPLAHVLTWAGLLCMGLFSSLFVLTLLRDVLLLGAIGVQWIVPQWLDMGFIRSVSAQFVAPLALVMTLIGFWNARRTAAVVRVDVPIANLPDALVGFSMAQISDIHVGPTIKQAYLERIVARVNGLHADLVAITGDLVDGPVQTLGPLVDPLKDLRSTHGTFFVTGNHEYYSGAQGWVDKLRTLGIQVLMNEHVVIAHGNRDAPASRVVVAGVTDYSAHHFDSRQQSDPQQALAGAPEHVGFKLLLAHQPRSADAAADAGYNLQLSGHTHGGQFWPWGYFVRLQQPFTAGLHKLKNLWVYTSRGTGYWGPPKRFGAASEITCLQLVRDVRSIPQMAEGPM